MVSLNKKSAKRSLADFLALLVFAPNYVLSEWKTYW